jgi:hypothetical protein
LPPTVVHWAEVITAQNPFGKQHAPTTGCGQVVAVQVVLSP